MPSKFTKTLFVIVCAVSLIAILVYAAQAQEQVAPQPTTCGWLSLCGIGQAYHGFMQLIHVEPAPASIIGTSASIDDLLLKVMSNPNTAPLITEQPKGTYTITISSSYQQVVQDLPFQSAMVYDGGTAKWDAITVGANSATISDSVVLPAPQYWLYPSQNQIGQFEQAVMNSIQQGTVSAGDKITLTSMWVTMNKRKVN